MPRWLTFLPLLTVPLLWLSYHPADQSWLAYLALSPWFAFLILETRIRRACVMSFFTWFLFFVVGLNWLRFTTGLGALVLCFILGLEMFLCAWLMKRWLAWRNDPIGWCGLGVMFVGFEFLRTYLMGGFPWFLLGHSQYNFHLLAQCADLGGMALLAFPVALVNGLVAGTVATRVAGRPFPPGLALYATGAALLLAAMTGYGAWRLTTLRKVPGPRIGLVQGNVPQDLKEDAVDGNSLRRTFDDHAKLTMQVAQESDLILWAETMFPYFISPRFPENEEAIGKLARRANRPLLLGLVREDEQRREYNSAIYMGANGKRLGVYDKHRLVLIAETMPWRASAPWLGKFIEKVTALRGMGRMWAGEALPVMEVKGARFGTLICYDTMWPDESREYAAGGAEFFAVLSNDGWFKDSEQLDQILVVTALRAIENRVGIARCTNTGISAFIEPDGTIREFEVGGKVKSVRGATAGVVSLKAADSLYTSWGEWFGRLCIVMIGVLAGLGSVMTRRKASVPTPGADGTPPAPQGASGE